MTEKQELKAKALELSVSLYAGLSEEMKSQLFANAKADKRGCSAEAVTLSIADRFLEYIG